MNIVISTLAARRSDLSAKIPRPCFSRSSRWNKLPIFSHFQSDRKMIFLILSSLQLEGHSSLGIYRDHRLIASQATTDKAIIVGSLCSLVTPHVREGGFRLAYVMPNLKPPITTTEMAVAYKKELETIDSSVEYLMTLYLSPELTPDEIRKAKQAGIAGVKSYPRGVTTNSDGGIESYEAYYPVFEAMEQEGLILNLHGEIPSDPKTNTCVLNAEEHFLPHLKSLHERFPKLRIVLEHATTRAAVEAVKSLGDTVGCTITAHHLALTVDDWAGQSFHFCKPVAKYPDDRLALQEVIQQGHPRFFLGSDSAPHPVSAKSIATPTHGCAAGVYTSPVLLPLVAHLLESFGALDKLQGFVSDNGRQFYGRTSIVAGDVVKLRREKSVVQDVVQLGNDVVAPFWAGEELNFTIVS